MYTSADVVLVDVHRLFNKNIIFYYSFIIPIILLFIILYTSADYNIINIYIYNIIYTSADVVLVDVQRLFSDQFIAKYSIRISGPP